MVIVVLTNNLLNTHLIDLMVDCS